MEPRTLWMMAFTVVAWASAFPAIRIALTAYNPAQLGFFRFVVAGIALLVIGAAARLRPPAPRDMVRIALLGVLGMAAYAIALGYGQKQVPAGTASLLIASAPVWMVAIAAAIGRERPTARALVGIGVSFAGVVLIAASRGLSLAFGPHAAAVLAAAIASAAYNVAQRPLVARYGALRFTIVAVWGAAFALLPLAGGLLHTVRTAPLPATMAILYLAIFPAALGYAAWAHVSARASAAVAGSALYLVPAVSMVLSNLLLGEVPSVTALAGGALILVGVFAVHRRRAGQGSNSVPLPRPAGPAAALARPS